MSVKHDIARQVLLILSHSKESALLMINYYYYNHFGSSRENNPKSLFGNEMPSFPSGALGEKKHRAICNARGSSYEEIRASWEAGATKTAAGGAECPAEA